MSECNRKTCKLSGELIPELGDGEPAESRSPEPLGRCCRIKNHNGHELHTEVKGVCIKWKPDWKPEPQPKKPDFAKSAQILLRHLAQAIGEPTKQAIAEDALYRMWIGQRVDDCAELGDGEPSPPPTNDQLDEQFFYELMQSYRHTPVVDQAGTIAAFEAIKKYIRANWIYRGAAQEVSPLVNNIEIKKES